ELLLEQIDGAVPPVQVQELRERTGVVRILGEDGLVPGDDAAIERVALDAPVPGLCGGDRDRGQAQGTREEQSKAPHPRRIIAARSVRCPSRARRYARIRARSEPRCLRRRSMQKSRIMRAWLRAIARKRTPSPAAMRSSLR